MTIINKPLRTQRIPVLDHLLETWLVSEFLVCSSVRQRGLEFIGRIVPHSLLRLGLIGAEVWSR